MLLFLATLGCQRPPAPACPAPVAVTLPAREIALAVPRAPRPPVLAQHDDDAIWQTAAGTGPWKMPQSQAAARPYSNARLLWDAENLYVCLYAADQDIEAQGARSDAFLVQIQAEQPTAPILTLAIAPTGQVAELARLAMGLDATWRSEAQVSMDRDGSLNDAAGEDDEEWVAFVALPWSQVGMTAQVGLRLQLRLERCDVPKDGVRRCGEWTQAVMLADTPTMASR